MAWRTTDEPRTVFVTVRFTEDEARDLVEYQQDANLKDRSAAVRNCVDRVVAAEKRRKKRAKGDNG
jgi:hypothetical protein